MSNRLTIDEIDELWGIADDRLPSRGADLLGDAIAELKERRAQDLNDEERDAIAITSGWLRSLVFSTEHSQKWQATALSVLSRLRCKQ